MTTSSRQPTLRPARVLAVATAALSLLLAPSAHARPFPEQLLYYEQTFGCLQSYAARDPLTGESTWVNADRGSLEFDANSTDEPTEYHYLPPGSDVWQTGAWTFDGNVHFENGPLARQAEGWPTLSGHWFQPSLAMPNDQIRGRLARLVLRSLGDGSGDVAEAPPVDGQEGRDPAQRSYWYCAHQGVVPRDLFTADQVAQVERRSGLALRLPTWLELNTHTTSGPRPVHASVVLARKGEYRVDVIQDGTVVYFRAKRAPIKELWPPLERLKKVGNGIRGHFYSIGCGPHPGLWGPVVCGQNVILWRQRGVNYAIQSAGAGDPFSLREVARLIVAYS